MNVGYRLYREVRDFAPASLSSGELVVAWVIADDANDTTRQSWLPLAELCFRSRLKPSAVRAALAKLAAKGYEFRVSHGYGSDGRPVFAARGHATDYRVPDFVKGATELAPKPVGNPPKGASPAAPNREGKAPVPCSKAPAKPPKGATGLAPLSSIPSTSTSEKAGVPVITPSVEVTPAPVDNGHFDFFAARSKP